MKVSLQTNKFFTSLLLLSFALVLAAAEAEAQRNARRTNYGAVGVSVGAMNYFGDIVPQPNFTSLRLKSARPSIGVDYTYKFAPRLAVKGALAWGRIIGDDARSASSDEGENLGRYKRNLSFRNDIKELSAVAIIDLFENRSTYQRRPGLIPYGFIGLALFHHNPKAYYQNGSRPGLDRANDIPTGWYELQPLGTEGQYAGSGAYPAPYKRLQVAVPFGLGVRFKMDRHWDMSLEINWRKTFTDYLDDVSTSFVDKSTFLSGYSGTNGKAAAILSDRSVEAFPGLAAADPSGTVYEVVPGYGTSKNAYRGDASGKDWYITTNLHVSYILAQRIRSPKFR